MTRSRALCHPSMGFAKSLRTCADEDGRAGAPVGRGPGANGTASKEGKLRISVKSTDTQCRQPASLLELQALEWMRTCALRLSTVALFVRAEDRGTPSCPSQGDWVSRSRWR